ncbi:YybH family protein [Rufibacter psychrotolerans]|uniref:YybH family protein n=1 Tax=Rufibacter psychrotolerans TaxID=2812556 RepID=UPI00196870BA|nr:SgcJ/EcaC family oxidoreductase [Rufibacter sp. SYSU D00308]
MKKLFTLVFLLGMASTLKAQQLPARDSLLLHGMIADWNRAWEVKDHALAARWYSRDAHFTNAFGDKRLGQAQIEALLQEVFALPFVMAGKSETTEHRYQVLSSTQVIVHTAVTRKGQQLPDGSVLPDRRTTHLRVFQKEKEGWRIKAHLISDARDKQTAKH